MIETRGVRLAYPGAREMRFADVTLPPGGTLLLRGPSGSGKSSWLTLAAGLRLPTAGQMRVAGQDLSLLGQRQRDAWRAHHVGFLPQRLHLSEALTVADNLALAYFAAGLPADWRAVRQALSALGLAEWAQRRPAQLSGGQALRVALARALLLRPAVLLVDEPTASLDDVACATVLQCLQQQAQAAGACLVLATHDARVWQAMPHAQVLHLALGDGAGYAGAEVGP